MYVKCKNHLSQEMWIFKKTILILLTCCLYLE